jgi:FkbM family methyltransferase
MLRIINNAWITLTKGGPLSFFKKLITYLHIRYILLTFTFLRDQRRIDAINTILKKQSYDEFSLPFNKFAAKTIHGVNENTQIIVPNFLFSVFNLAAKKILYISIINYRDASSITKIDKQTIIILHGPMIKQILSLQKITSSYPTFFHNQNYTVISNYSLCQPLSSLFQWPLEEISNKFDYEEYVFSVRPNTMDTDIVAEVKHEYIDWIIHNINEPLDVVMDIGGHIGSFSVLASKYTSSNAKQFIYEPVPENFQLVNENIEQNNLKGRIVAFPKAISDKLGSATLHISSDNTGGSRLHLPDPSSIESVIVPVSTLEEEVKLLGVQTIDLLKIDVEGSEQAILFSSKNLLKTKVKYLICEAGGSMRGDGNDVLIFLNEIGFDTTHHGNEGLMIIYGINSHLINSI